MTSTNNTTSPTAANAAAVAAATSSSNKTIDEHLAQTIHTLDQLTTIFNFPHHLAKLAIDACG